jgi:hypothetical protein
MKKQRIIFLVVIAIAIVIWWFFPRRAPETIMQTVNTNSQSTDSKASGANEATAQASNVQPAAGSQYPAQNAVMEYLQKVKAEPQYDGKQPISFYGRVVDESNNAVMGANIHFNWNGMSSTGNSQADTVSDGNGFFSLTGEHGKYLYVTVGKEGYYSAGNARGEGFEYANPANGLFTPDAGNPVVFYLREKGVGVDLITSQNGMSADLQIHIQRDGTPVEVDFYQRKTSSSGQMQVTEIKPDLANWKQATNWSFQLSIPDGGFIVENDEFPFMAPELGYQPVVGFNFQKSKPDWTTDISTNYYIEFGTPPRFGWLHIETGISYGGAILTYAINPDGSRNLEPKLKP